MSESASDQRDAAAEPGGADVTPALLAARLATIVGDDAGIRSGELPLWGRLDRPRRGQSRRSKWLARIGWSVAGGLLVIAALRIFFHDATVPFTWLNAFTLYLYLPAYATLAFAAWAKRWWLATASAAVVACHLTWVLPDFRAATPYVPTAASALVDAPGDANGAAQPIRIFYTNIRAGNLRVQETLDEAYRADADVIVFAEVYRWWMDQVRESDLSKRYPYGTDLRNRHAGDLLILSRLRVSRLEVILVENRATIAVDIPLGEETLRLFAMHGPRPLIHAFSDYDRFWDALEPIVTKTKGPVAVVGDFNATQHSRVYQKLVADGLRSAHDDRGRGYVTTWPNGVHWIPPIRIDQAFLSRAVECVSIREGVGPGTDHKPLIIDLLVHPPEAVSGAR